MVYFGQVVVGPPGSGKTTYCKAMATFLHEIGRKVAIVNLDPANETLPYKAAVDINELVIVQEVMETQGLGPNGALVYCMELLAVNVMWLIEKLKKFKGHYFLFDFPGQAELYAHHSMVKTLLACLEKEDIRLCATYLIDSHFANDPGKYISAVLLVLNSMLQLEVATVNVLSKIDAVEKYGKLDFGLEYYTEVLDLEYLLDRLDDNPLTKKYASLNKAIAETITDYSLVTFIPLSVDDRRTLMSVLKAVDKANGYVFGAPEERNIQKLLSCAVGTEVDRDRFGYVRDAFMEDDDDENEENKILNLMSTQNE